jgi:hypothetical protein
MGRRAVTASRGLSQRIGDVLAIVLFVVFSAGVTVNQSADHEAQPGTTPGAIGRMAACQARSGVPLHIFAITFEGRIGFLYRQLEP